MPRINVVLTVAALMLRKVVVKRKVFYHSRDVIAVF